MAINDRLLKLDGYDVSTLCEYTVEYNKIWKDAERNMEGELRSTLIGVFPKIKVKTITQDLAKVRAIGNLLNRPYITVAFYDPLKARVMTAQYYANDFSVTLRERERELFESMSFNLIPFRREA